MTSFPSKALRLAAAAFTALSVVTTLAGCSHIKAAFQSPTPSAPAPARLSDAQQGALHQQQGVIAKQDYLRLVTIQDGINRTQKVSDDDVVFIVRQLNSLPVQNTSKNAAEAQKLVLGHTVGAKPKQLTPSQRGRLYTAILPYTSSPDQWVQVAASLALASTRDPRAIPVLQRMAQSSQYSVVRLDAGTWLKRLREAGVTSGQASQ